MTPPVAYLQTVAQIEAMLLGRVGLLARELAPGGTVAGHEYVALNPARNDHKLGSFSINLTSGKWADFSADVRGLRQFPCLSLIAYLVTERRWKSDGETRPGCIRWARDWLGLTDRNAPPSKFQAMAEQAERVSKQQVKDETRKADGRRQAAYAMWLDAKALTDGDPVWLYLKGRGIDLAKLLAVPNALKYAPACRYYTGEGQFTKHPAMLAAMHLEGLPGGFAAVHRTYLGHDADGGWTKAFGGGSKKILGSGNSGATIRLTRGASGKNLKSAPDGEWIAVAEGIENALSAALVKPELRMLAAGTVGNIGRIVLPEQIGGIYIIADNDKPSADPKKRGGYEALSAASDALCERGIDHDIIRAPAGYKDFNDALCGKRMLDA